MRRRGSVYAYDPLNNLLSINQTGGSRTRTFTYDFSRPSGTLVVLQTFPGAKAPGYRQSPLPGLRTRGFRMWVEVARRQSLFASFFAISSTIFGRRSAITLSTMLAIVLASVADTDPVPPSAEADAAMAFGASSTTRSCFAVFTSLLAAALAGVVWI